MTSSINTNIAAYYAQANIAIASDAAQASVSRLSSGNRIVKASDDVAALSTGTSLQTQVTALKTALTNTSQGSSLLQVADGGLSQITDILQRQKAIAVQASSGQLTDTDRGYLNQEFQSLSQEIDRLTGSVNFNGVHLLNGDLSTSSSVQTTTTASTAGSLSTTFTDNIAVGENVIINGSTFYAVAQNATATGNQFNVGSSLTSTVANLAARLNTLADNTAYNSTVGAATFSASNQTLTATARAGGSLSSFTFGAPQAITTAGTSLTTTNASNSVVIATANTAGYAVGQSIIIGANTANTLAGVNGIPTANLRGVITAITNGTSITFAAQSNATSGSTVANAVTFGLDTVNGVGEANSNGGGVGSSFNLFATTTGFTTPTTAISTTGAAATTAAVPFKNGDALKVTVNGVQSTLFTFGSGSTLTDLVNGVNANSGSTGFSAALVYSAGTYNVRLNYAGTAGNVLVDGGSNYFSTAAATNLLTGMPISGANALNTGNNASYSGKSLVSTGYIDLFTTPLTTANETAATTTSATMAGTTAAVPFVVGTTINAVINGQNVAISNPITTGETLDGVVTDINSKSASTGVYALVVSNGANFNIRLFVTTPNPASDPVSVIVPGGGTPVVNTAQTLTTTLGGLTQTTTASLAGGQDNGLSAGSVSVAGTTGDSILQSIGQTHANSSVLLTQNAVSGDSITVGGQQFVFTNTISGAAPNEILIGSSVQDTVNNAVSKINSYLKNGTAIGDTAYQLNQLTVSGTGNSIVFTAKGLGNVTTLSGAVATVSQSVTGGSLIGGTLNNGSATFGVDTTGVTNAAFTGTLQGFTATYDGTASTADVSIKIGDNTYTAKAVNLNVTSDTRIRFYSDTANGQSGGYFDIQLKAGQVNAFSDQNGATTAANRLNAAFSSLSFSQVRNVSSYNGTQSISSNNIVTGSLVGTKVTAQIADFDDAKLSAVSVSAPSGSTTDAKITLVINGVNYSTANGIGSKLGANQTYKLTSATDPNQFVNFTTGSQGIDLSTADYASAAQAALSSAFGATAGSAALSFQVGSSSSDTLSVSIGSASTASLFNGQTLDVSTQAGAQAASTALDTALEDVTTLRASVGALQSRFNFASANIQTSIQNQDAARGELLDTDVASESTDYANAQVKLQAGISVLAQANQQLQNLLKLIQ